MLTVRAVRLDDLDRLHALIRKATLGLTSLQLDRATLHDRVELSQFAFSRTAPIPRGDPFVLVMEDTATGELVGTSTVYAKTGGYQPFYVFRRIESTHHSEQLHVSTTRQRLELTRIHDGPTEIGSLFLRRSYRGGGNGRWLSLARFALIAMYRHRFADTVIAEMRGRGLPDGTVPFWESVTSRFLPVDFATADAASTVCKQFLEELMPKHPIYIDLLSAEVRDQIGTIHDETAPALRLLKNEGFGPTDMVDIFDGGPTIRAMTDDIHAVRRTREVTIESVEAGQPPTPDDAMASILISKHAGLTSLLVEASPTAGSIRLSRAAATVLNVSAGDICHCLAVRDPRASSAGRPPSSVAGCH